MIAQVVLTLLLSLTTVMLTAGPVLAHSGGLDAYGCHHDRKNGGYHCHQGPFAGQSYESKQEMLNAQEAQHEREEAGLRIKENAATSIVAYP